MKKSILSSILPILPSWADPDIVEIRPVSQGGSVRGYYRISSGHASTVLMDSSALPDDFKCFMSLSQKLKQAGVPVPEVYSALPDKCLALLEDLGDSTLYSLLKAAASKEELTPRYEEVLKFLVRMQSASEFSLMEREFDFKGIRWETDYFFRQFIVRHCGITPENQDELFEEFDALAERLEKVPRVFMHRDFQSQNIMVGPKGVCFIDFQGARLGLPHYDLVSLLRDPYAGIPEGMEKHLLEFYVDLARPKEWFDEASFREYYRLAGVQRHSQALGAFAYLSLELKKTQFLAHIRPCLEYLCRELEERDELPRFRELAREAAGVCNFSKR
ncbi:MAG: phosphotransferase [Nitrospinae bacterium]|nr:phosphotransferase [Nitrospinota bacterium]